MQQASSRIVRQGFLLKLADAHNAPRAPGAGHGVAMVLMTLSVALVQSSIAVLFFSLEWEMLALCYCTLEACKVFLFFHF